MAMRKTACRADLEDGGGGGSSSRGVYVPYVTDMVAEQNSVALGEPDLDGKDKGNEQVGRAAVVVHDMAAGESDQGGVGEEYADGDDDDEDEDARAGRGGTAEGDCKRVDGKQTKTAEEKKKVDVEKFLESMGDRMQRMEAMLEKLVDGGGVRRDWRLERKRLGGGRGVHEKNESAVTLEFSFEEGVAGNF